MPIFSIIISGTLITALRIAILQLLMLIIFLVYLEIRKPYILFYQFFFLSFIYPGSLSPICFLCDLLFLRFCTRCRHGLNGVYKIPGFSRSLAIWKYRISELGLRPFLSMLPCFSFCTDLGSSLETIVLKRPSDFTLYYLLYD